MIASQRIPLKQTLLTLGLATAMLLTACARPASESGKEADEAMSPGTESTTKSCVVNPPKETFACTMEYLPVCGCDDKTYSNACMAKAAGVPEVTPGACESQDD